MNCFGSRFFLLLGLFLLCDAQTAAPTTRATERSTSNTTKDVTPSSTPAPSTTSSSTSSASVTTTTAPIASATTASSQTSSRATSIPANGFTTSVPTAADFQTVTVHLKASVLSYNGENEDALSEALSKFLSQALLQHNCIGCTVAIKQMKRT
ncbi:integumentary mucin A.1-like isoform X2 [Channa argus]|uniref:integumentary mucin A.1-like isoform X2 n=1 Tax=Channa argus TaxID=215402 RepID=UPI00351FC7E0